MAHDIRGQQPHPDRISEAYADERIREKLDFYATDRPRAGLRNVDAAMKRDGVPAAWRLHYITAVAHLGAGRRGMPMVNDGLAAEFDVVP